MSSFRKKISFLEKFNIEQKDTKRRKDNCTVMKRGNMCLKKKRGKYNGKKKNPKRKVLGINKRNLNNRMFCSKQKNKNKKKCKRRKRKKRNHRKINRFFRSNDISFSNSEEFGKDNQDDASDEIIEEQVENYYNDGLKIKKLFEEK